MSFKDYYKILGLETNKVSLDEIKLAYREQAKKYHPDINMGDSYSEEKFKEVNEAYKILSDSKTRKKYDRSWFIYTERKRKIQEKETEEKKTFKEKLMSIFFGINPIKKKNVEEKRLTLKGENIETEVDISIIEAFNGTKKKLKLLAVDGKTRTFSLDIPAGIQNEDRIRFVGQGKPGKNGGKNGDLLVRIFIKDSKEFKLNGADIYKEVNITPWEAALGTKLTVESIDGEVSLIIPKGTQSGERFTIKGKGYKIGRGLRGNFYIITKIVVPKKLSIEEENLYKKLKELQNCDTKVVVNK